MCDECGVEYVVKPTDLYEIIFEVRKEENPCALCARMRRGILHDTAKELGCNKIALGHHQDDFLTTMLMNLMYEGSFHAMHPSMTMEHYPITLIRPLCLVPEQEINALEMECQLSKQIAACPYEDKTKRLLMQKEIFHLCQMHSEARNSMWHALEKNFTAE